MTKQVVSDPILFPLAKSGPAISCTDSPCASSQTNSNWQDASLVEAEYLHPLVETEASETSEGSDSCIRSYNDEEYNGLLPDNGSIVANAANGARNFEDQVFYIVRSGGAVTLPDLRTARKSAGNIWALSGHAVQLIRLR